MIEKKFDNINLFIFPTREEMGKKAADDAEICINKLLKNGSPLPDGYRFGQSDLFKMKNSEGNKRRWQHISLEQKEIIAKNVSNGIKNFWNNISETDKKLREQHRVATRSQ